MNRLSSRYWISFLLFFLVVAAFVFPAVTLQTDDASMYAAAIRNAVLFHDWVLPTLDPSSVAAFLDKPPVGIWLLSIIPAILGFSQFSLHLTNVLLWGLSAAVMTWGVSRFASRNWARWSGLILMTSIAAVVYSRSPKLEIAMMLCLILIHGGIFGWIKQRKPVYLYATFAAIAVGFLIKTGFAVVLPGLTVLGMVAVFPAARNAIVPTLKSLHFWVAVVMCKLIVIVPLAVQYYAYPQVFPAYLNSILLTSKYNRAYLGLGLHGSIFLFLILAALPWVPFAISSIAGRLKRPPKRIFSLPFTLDRFAVVWLFASTSFLVLAYQQVDFRTAVMLLPPIAVLAARGVQKRIDWRWLMPWPILLGIAGLIFVLNPANFPLARGVVMAITVGLIGFYGGWMLNRPLIAVRCLIVTFALFFAYEPRLVPLFSTHYADADVIGRYRSLGFEFIVMRPQDRPLKMRADLCFEDVIVGPADQYVQSDPPPPTKPQILITNPEAVSQLDPRWRPILQGSESVILIR